ncbi:hypothetical protein [Luteolibacter sp. Populi]|uniref:hypothetical protein n=1 Tax=Luteolibacter sp. Populi TaxID=3230487 RepID=UPI003466D227
MSSAADQNPPADLIASIRSRVELEKAMDTQSRRNQRDGAAEVAKLQEILGDPGFEEWANSYGDDATVLSGWTAIARMDDATLDAAASRGRAAMAELVFYENGNHEPEELLNYLHRKITGTLLNAYEDAKKAGRLLVQVSEHVPGGTLPDWLVEHFDGSAEEAAIFLHAHSMTPAQFSVRMAALGAEGQTPNQA